MKNKNLEKIHNLELEMLNEIVRICNKYDLNYFLIAGSLIGAVRHQGFIPWDDDLDIAMPREDYEKFISICSRELNERFLIDSYDTNKNYFRLAAKIRAKNTIYMEDYLVNYKGPHGIWIDILPLDYSVKSKSIILSVQSVIKSTLQVAIMKKQKADISDKKTYKRVISTIVSLLPVSFLTTTQTKIMKLQNNKTNKKYIVNLASKYGYKKQIFLIEDYFPAQKLKFENDEYCVPNHYDVILKKIYGDYMKVPPKELQTIHNPIKIKFEDGVELSDEEI
jgi:lipopolysaccharide cholinephosphotransferase